MRCSLKNTRPRLYEVWDNWYFADMKKYDQLSEDEQKSLHESFLKEPEAFYEKAERDQLKKALKRTYEERFFMMTSLMKLNIMLSKAKITYTPFISSNKA
jgi:hypothetical protein